MKTLKITLILFAVFIIGNSALFAQDVDNAKKVVSLAKEANQKYGAKEFKSCAELNTEAFNRTGKNGIKKEYSFAYNAVCCWALFKDVDKAYNVLLQVIDKPGFKEFYSNLKSDRDLSLLRSDDRWKQVDSVINR